LQAMADADVMAVLAVVMGETLAVGSVAVDLAGTAIGLDMAQWWRADQALFDLLRDRQVLAAIVGEVAGEAVATANAGEKTSTLKAIIRDQLDGTNGRDKRDGWVPRWMAFPTAAYTDRGGVATVDRAVEIAAAQALIEASGEPESMADPVPLAA